MGRTVVVGYDGSPASRAAVEQAAMLAGVDGKIFAVHAYAPPHDWLGRPEYQRMLDDHRQRGEAVLGSLEPPDGVELEAELLAEHAVDALLAVAGAREAD